MARRTVRSDRLISAPMVVADAQHWPVVRPWASMALRTLLAVAPLTRTEARPSPVSPDANGNASNNARRSPRSKSNSVWWDEGFTGSIETE